MFSLLPRTSRNDFIFLLMSYASANTHREKKRVTFPQYTFANCHYRVIAATARHGRSNSGKWANAGQVVTDLFAYGPGRYPNFYRPRYAAHTISTSAFRHASGGKCHAMFGQAKDAVNVVASPTTTTRVATYLTAPSSAANMTCNGVRGSGVCAKDKNRW